MSTSEKPTKSTIFAAGAVLWRWSCQKSKHSTAEIEVALIHRPRYDDWSLPKGKLDPGETGVIAAIREIQEETGFRSHLGRYLTKINYQLADGQQKRVDYWNAHVISGKFSPNNEVDQLLWLSPAEAISKVTYSFDRKVLHAFTALPADTTTVLLVRHAKAGRSERYRGNDYLRPLDKNGRTQAEALVPQLLAFGATEVRSADRTRCIQTVEHLAEELGVAVLLEPLLSEEGYRDNKEDARRRAQEIATLSGVQVICSQGRVIPDLTQWWANHDGVTLKSARNRKASMWVLSFDKGKLVAADHLDSPLPVVHKKK
ncbi:MAG: NUDIX hydrolase [Mycobacteriaceae bacterium]